MYRKHYLPSLCILASLTSSSFAATSLPLTKMQVQDLVQHFDLQFKTKTASSPVNTLALLEEHRDLQGKSHIRLQQFYQGIPVFGGYAIVHGHQSFKEIQLQPDKFMMNGKVFLELQKDLNNKPLQYVEKGQQILAQFLEAYASQKIEEQTIKPIIYVDALSKAHWAYQLSALITEKDKIPKRPTVIVDAQTYKIYLQWNDIKTTWSFVQGQGYGGNKKIGTVQYGKELPYLKLTRRDDLNTCYMENLEVKVVDLNHRKEGYNPMSFACAKKENDLNIFWTGKKGDGYDKVNGALSPINDALYAGQIIKDLYKNWYEVEVLKTKRNVPMQLVMRVHYGKTYENAFWDGRQMTFGDGGAMMYPLVSLGIAAHEVSHGFTEQNSGLIYTGQSGGMNEAFSDMASQAAEFYSLGTNSWQIGAEIMKYEDALRYMDHPSRDGVSIESASDYKDYLDVHHSSGVYNRLFYLIATKPGWDTRKAFNLMVKANKDYWTPYESFKDGACGLLSAAQDLKYNLLDIKTALTEVAISTEACSG